MNVMGMGSLAGGYVSRFSAYGQSSIVAFQALGDISPGQELVQCQQRLLTQMGMGRCCSGRSKGSLLQAQKHCTKRKKCTEKAVAYVLAFRSCKLDLQAWSLPLLQLQVEL